MSDGSGLIEIGALWEQETKAGKIYMSGKLGESSKARIVLFPNDSENERAPQWRVYLAPNRPREESGDQQAQQAPRKKKIHVEPMTDTDYDGVPF